MSEKLKIRVLVYDLIIRAYDQLTDIEKENFNNGLSMFFDNKYFIKHKRTNINYEVPVVPEVWELTSFVHYSKELLNNQNKIDHKKLFEKNTILYLEKTLNGIKINGIDYLNFLRALKSIITLIAINESNNNEDLQSKISDINLGFEIIQNRFNFNLNHQPKELEQDYLGKPTIILNEKKSFSKTKLLIELKNKKFINKNQDSDLFMKIFDGNEIKLSQRVVWIGSNYSLMIFLKNIKPFTVFNSLKDLYITATRCFVKKDGTSFSYYEILKSRGNNEIKNVISEISKRIILNSNKK